MSVLRRLFSATYRRARIAEARGEYRDAAALYAAAGAELEAATALAHAAERCERLDDALGTYRDALRWAPPGSALRKELLGRFGGRVLDRTRRQGVASQAERRLLAEAAAALDEAGRPLDAAAGYELLGDWERVAGCLERAGEVERLEALLTRRGQESEVRRTLDRHLAAHRAAMEVGARAEARRLLEEAAALAPGDPLLGEVMRELEARRPRPHAVRLSLAEERRVIVCLGEVPVELGREGALPLRGASLSRRHARVGRVGARLVVEDLGSRNGTRIGGVPIEGAVEVEPPVELGLGEDVTLRCALAGDGGFVLRVERGLDRGLTALVSASPVTLPAGDVALGFPNGWATLYASRERPVLLEGRRCVAPIELLSGDRFEVLGARLEVLG
jgi:hypothetical protein